MPFRTVSQISATLDLENNLLHLDPISVCIFHGSGINHSGFALSAGLILYSPDPKLVTCLLLVPCSMCLLMDTYNKKH